MRRRIRALVPVLVLLLAAPCLLAAKRPQGLGDVTDVRKWSYPDYTRVVVELTRHVDVEVKRLEPDPRFDRPERLYLDLEGIWVGRDYADGIRVEDGLLEKLRLGQNTLTRSRLVVDLQSYERYELRVLRSPDRVVLDVYGKRRRLPPSLRFARTVVIDPGHGGKDPGATGLGGLREKDVNLRLSMLLASRLEAEGFNVVLTRTNDRYLDLEERTAVAQATRADLFISIHANASRRKKTRGIEIYYLDKNYERHALEVAARENDVPRGEMDSLQRAVGAFRVEALSDQSERLADLVHGELVPGLSRKYRGVADLGVKKGPFYVLFLSSIPSILVESGFVTNKHDVKLLREREFLERVADHIAAGVVQYRGAVANVRPATRYRAAR